MSKKFNWKNLDYWKSGEWQVVEEKLDEEKHLGFDICPQKKDLFKTLGMVPYEKVRVCIIGQDPYANRRYATGIPFSIPEGEKNFPPSLRNIFCELVADLGVDYPRTGELSKWCQQGVLLWNAVPSCRARLAGSHRWPEWAYLTQEIVEKLDERQIVFALLGAHARAYRKCIGRSSVIETSHPSPLGAHKGFLGSKLFSRINSELQHPIDWSLSNGTKTPADLHQRSSALA